MKVKFIVKLSKLATGVESAASFQMYQMSHALCLLHLVSHQVSTRGTICLNIERKKAPLET